VRKRSTRRKWSRRALAALVPLGFAACVVSEEFDDAQFLCDPRGGADECPEGMTCGNDGLCRHGSAKPDGSAGDGSEDGCFPITCAAMEPQCGSLDDGCGHLIQCGCTAPNTCGGGGKTGECGCARNRSASGVPSAAFEQKVTGNVDWKDWDFALTSDDKWATTSTALASGKLTNILKVSAFQFTGLPTDAAQTNILGIEVTVERSATAGGIKDDAINLLIAGNPAKTPASKTGAWSATDTEAKYGSPTDLWGEASITLDQLLDSKFGVSLTAAATASDSPRVDAISVTVYFEDETCPGD